MTEALENGDEVERSPMAVFWVALRLGLTAFGGPAAHLAYFRDEYVVRRRWVTEETYADLIALAQAFPGAASSKVNMSIGMVRASSTAPTRRSLSRKGRAGTPTSRRCGNARSW